MKKKTTRNSNPHVRKLVKMLAKMSFLVVLTAGIYSCEFGNPFPVLEKEGLNQDKISNTKQWQAKLSGNKTVSSVLLPGTHDAGAFKGGVFSPLTGGIWGKTQNYNIREQLEIGVRAFDIRLRADGNSLRIYHGDFYQQINFNPNVLDQCVNFLNENSSEFLVLVIKKEGGDNGAYARLLNDRLNADNYKKYIIRNFESKLTVDQVRGKILILHRNDIGANAASGTIKNWDNNATFQGTIQNSNYQKTSLFVEDQYSKDDLNSNQKWDVTRNHLAQSSRNTNPNDWFITFSSLSAAKTNPASEAALINPKIISHFNNNNKARGILFVDFAKLDLTKAIINANF